MKCTSISCVDTCLTVLIDLGPADLRLNQAFVPFKLMLAGPHSTSTGTEQTHTSYFEPNGSNERPPTEYPLFSKNSFVAGIKCHCTVNESELGLARDRPDLRRPGSKLSMCLILDEK